MIKSISEIITSLLNTRHMIIKYYTTSISISVPSLQKYHDKQKQNVRQKCHFNWGICLQSLGELSKLN